VEESAAEAWVVLSACGWVCGGLRVLAACFDFILGPSALNLLSTYSPLPLHPHNAATTWPRSKPRGWTSKPTCAFATMQLASVAVETSPEPVLSCVPNISSPFEEPSPLHAALLHRPHPHPHPQPHPQPHTCTIGSLISRATVTCWLYCTPSPPRSS